VPGWPVISSRKGTVEERHCLGKAKEAVPILFSTDCLSKLQDHDT
jgi:hypothetical protein